MFLPRSNRQISQHKEEYGNSEKRVAVAMLFFAMNLIAVSFFAPSYVIAQDLTKDKAITTHKSLSTRKNPFPRCKLEHRKPV